MSRILVADDNSNIQKMVALALKDEGIDVVAVGNGEAAMRRIPDLRPDLVLADIFMPVRNGYEVCEFVKNDSRYMNTPVVLLVGAFDPLDEQETQLVRADGVLKKPFVPPDPLINMVKALLAKSNGQKAVPVAPAAPLQPAAQTQPAPQAQATPAVVVQPNSSSEFAAPPAGDLVRHQSTVSAPVQEKMKDFVMPAPPIPSPIASTQDPDEVVTAARDPNLGEPFWAAPAEPQELEDESETETKPADMLDLHSFGKDESSVEPDDAPSFRPDATFLDSAAFGTDLAETRVSQNRAAEPQQTNRSQPPVPDEYEISADVAPIEEQAPSPSSASPETPPEIFKFDPTLTFASPAESSPIDEGSSASDRAVPDSADPVVSEYSATLSLPSLTDLTPVVPAITEKPLDTREPVALLDLELPALPNRDAVITAATEAARLAFSDLNTLPGSDRHAGEHMDSLPPSAPPDTTTSPTPEMVDAVVSRLLERMQPQIMEVVNREVLRPAIEAIVRREMKKN